MLGDHLGADRDRRAGHRGRTPATPRCPAVRRYPASTQGRPFPAGLGSRRGGARKHPAATVADLSTAASAAVSDVESAGRSSTTGRAARRRRRTPPRGAALESAPGRPDDSATRLARGRSTHGPPRAFKNDSSTAPQPTHASRDVRIDEPQQEHERQNARSTPTTCPPARKISRPCVAARVPDHAMPPTPPDPSLRLPVRRLASTSSVGAWTPCAASSAVVNALSLGPSSAKHLREACETLPLEICQSRAAHHPWGPFFKDSPLETRRRLPLARRACI